MPKKFVAPVPHLKARTPVTRRSAPEAHVSQLLTIDQVAARLQVHRTTVYEFINLSGLKVTRLAAHAVRIDEADLQEWITRRKEVS